MLVWFGAHARTLPWRGDRDPYRIWVSEVMLQQTQVATVVSYFARFLAAFPTLPDLADADEQAVLRLWEGLGYYRRARDMLRASQLLIAKEYRTLPDDPDLLDRLPGFGRYTVNAVLSQAFDRRLPIVEANSRRVLCRYFGIDADPALPAVDRQLWDFAERLLPRRAVGDFNQAMMELGALVCTAGAPDCANCPIALHCQARLQSRQHEIPRRVKRAEITQVQEVALVIRQPGDDAILLMQRPASGRWAKMWEVPHHELQPGESHADAARRLLHALDIAGAVGDDVITIRHGITRFRITMTCVAVAHRLGLPAGAVWVRPDELTAYPLCTPQRKLAAHLTTLAQNC